MSTLCSCGVCVPDMPVRLHQGSQTVSKGNNLRARIDFLECVPEGLKSSFLFVFSFLLLSTSFSALSSFSLHFFSLAFFLPSSFLRHLLCTSSCLILSVSPLFSLSSRFIHYLIPQPSYSLSPSIFKTTQHTSACAHFNTTPLSFFSSVFIPPTKTQ